MSYDKSKAKAMPVFSSMYEWLGMQGLKICKNFLNCET